MKVINVKRIPGVKFTGGISYRPVLATDGLGFSICKTVIPKSNEAHHWHYKNHLEACYCIIGSGMLTNLSTNESFLIKPDIVYVLDKNDDHTFLPLEDTVLISIFNPPLTGHEKHDKDGNYGI